MKKTHLVISLILLLTGCNAPVSPLIQLTNTAIPLPPTATQTQIPPTATPLTIFTPAPGTVVLDLADQFCIAQWMNGGQKFASCPQPGNDRDLSAGYAKLLDPLSENLPAGSKVLLTVPAWNGYAAFFMRYPTITIQKGDHFFALLKCQAAATDCKVSFGLDYYDANGDYHSPLVMWNYESGQEPVVADMDLSGWAGQKLDLVLALRPENDTPEKDLALWINPVIYRATR